MEQSAQKALQVSGGLQQLKLSAAQSKYRAPFKYFQSFQGQRPRSLKTFSRAVSLSSHCRDCMEFDVLDHFVAPTTAVELTEMSGRHPVGLVPPCVRLSPKQEERKKKVKEGKTLLLLKQSFIGFSTP